MIVETGHYALVLALALALYLTRRCRLPANCVSGMQAHRQNFPEIIGQKNYQYHLNPISKGGRRSTRYSHGLLVTKWRHSGERMTAFHPFRRFGSEFSIRPFAEVRLIRSRGRLRLLHFRPKGEPVPDEGRDT
jgi:hypothetical protein